MLKNVAHQLKCSTSEFNVLDDVIDTLRFRGSIFFHSNLAAPWGMSLSSTMLPRFHIALAGGFCVGTEQSKVTVAPMDIIMIPDGDMHWIADQVGRELVSSEQAGDACALGLPLFQQGEITNRVMCGLVEYDEAIKHPILSALPSIVHLANIKTNDNIWKTVELIDAEINPTFQISTLHPQGEWEIIISGSVVTPIRVSPGDNINITFTRLGSVNASFI